MNQHQAELAGLIEAVHSANLTVRANAVWALREHTQHSLPYLKEALRDKEPIVREAAAAALGAGRCREGIWALLEALGDRNYSVSAMAAKALGAIGEPATLPGLMQALRNPSPEVRKSAARALSLIGDPNAIPHVQRVARQDIVEDVRDVAREALLRLRYGKGGPVFEPEIIDFTVIVKKKGRSAQWVRYAVAALLILAFIPTAVAMVMLLEDVDVMLAGFAGGAPDLEPLPPSLASLAEYTIDQRLYPSASSTGYFFMAASSDGERLAVGSYPIDVWDVNTGQILYSTAPDGTQQIYSLAFSPDGSLLAAGGTGRVYIFNAEDGALIQTLQGQTGQLQAVLFDETGQHLYGANRSITIWRIATGDILQTLTTEDSSGSIISMAVGPDEERIATGMQVPSEHAVLLWDAASENVLFRFEATGPVGSMNPVEALAYSPDGRYIAAAPGYAQAVPDQMPRPITVWDTGRGVEALRLDGHINSVTALAYLRDGQILASTSYDGTIKLWDAQTGNLLETLSPGGHIYDLAVSADDQKLFTLTDDSIAIWEAVLQ